MVVHGKVTGYGTVVVVGHDMEQMMVTCNGSGNFQMAVGRLVLETVVC